MTEFLNRPIRAATEADIPAMAAAINAAYSVERFFIEGDRTNAGELLSLMAKGVFLVAEDPPGALAGSVFVKIDDQGGYCGLLAVAPERQGEGWARRLVESAEGYVRTLGCVSMRLTVLNVRTELPGFYARLGYTAYGTAPFEGSASIPCHCILMSKGV